MDVREKLTHILTSEPEMLKNLNMSTIKLYRLVDKLIAHGVTVQEWISVEERLPNVNTNKSGYERKGVIVCIDGSSAESAYRVYERACNRGKTVYRWKYPWDTISDENITHWMPLPNRRKENNNANNL